MHRLEDEASALVRHVGCVACVLGDSPGGPSACPDYDPSVAERYSKLIAMVPWAGTAPSLPHTHPV